MKKVLIIVLMLLFGGCTKLYNSNEVSVNDTNVVYSYQNGVVKDVKKVVIKDDGSGVMTGAVVGTVLGSMFGKNNGNLLSTLLGGLGGAYVGYKADRANGEELYILLDDGREIVTIVKGVNIRAGERVRIVFNANRVVRVEKL